MTFNTKNFTVKNIQKAAARRALASIFVMSVSATFATDAVAASANDLVSAAVAKKAQIDAGSSNGTRLPQPYLAPGAAWTVWLTEGQVRLSDLVHQGAFAANDKWGQNGAIVATPRMGFAAAEERALQAVEAALDVQRNRELKAIAEKARTRLEALVKAGGAEAKRANRELGMVKGQIARLDAAVVEASTRYTVMTGKVMTGKAAPKKANNLAQVAVPKTRQEAANKTVALYRAIQGSDHAGFQSTAYGNTSGSTGLTFDMVEGLDGIGNSVSGSASMGGMVRLGVPLGGAPRASEVRGGGGGEGDARIGDLIAKRSERLHEEQCAVRRIVAAYDALEAAKAGAKELKQAGSETAKTVRDILDSAERQSALVNLETTALFAGYKISAATGELAGTAKTVKTTPIRTQTAEILQ